MDRRLMLMFLRQAWYQCEYVQYAARELNETRLDSLRTFYAIERLLVAAANISKIFWGGNTVRISRDELRDAVGLTEKSSLRERDVRNAFEHFDERIEAWWQLSVEEGAYGFTDMNVGVMAQASSNANVRSFRSFQPRTNTLYFWGMPYDLWQLVAEVIELQTHIENEAQDDPIIVHLKGDASQRAKAEQIILEVQARREAANDTPGL